MDASLKKTRGSTWNVGLGSHELYRNPKKHMRDYEEVTEATEDSYATRDPVNINETRNKIDQAARLRLHEETRPKTRQRSRLYQSCADSGPGILPLEVRLNILDLLKDRHDIWNMRIAFHGQWWIRTRTGARDSPVKTSYLILRSYWRTRVMGYGIDDG
ncbi:hypothetical protein VTN00DRAFT_6278 [Thermoascus crustaceus]|uniref:uncharacterized protein n=1 Tax=Thermoascus crustaceus TaxID=5088 RepID=UPI0037434A98